MNFVTSLLRELRELRYFVTSLLRYFVTSLLRDFVTSLLRYFVTSLLRYFVNCMFDSIQFILNPVPFLYFEYNCLLNSEISRFICLTSFTRRANIGV